MGVEKWLRREYQLMGRESNQNNLWARWIERIRALRLRVDPFQVGGAQVHLGSDQPEARKRRLSHALPPVLPGLRKDVDQFVRHHAPQGAAQQEVRVREVTASHC